MGTGPRDELETELELLDALPARGDFDLAVGGVLVRFAAFDDPVRIRSG